VKCPKCNQEAGRRFEADYEIEKCPMDKPHTLIAKWCHVCDHWCIVENDGCWFCPSHVTQ
jgi:hypothetical protein